MLHDVVITLTPEMVNTLISAVLGAVIWHKVHAAIVSPRKVRH